MREYKSRGLFGAARLHSVIVPVILDSNAKAAYDKLEKEILLEVDESTIDAGSAAVLSNKLRQ